MPVDAWTLFDYIQAARRCGAEEFEAFIQACAQGSIPDHLPRLSRSAERTLRTALIARGISIEQEQLDPDDDLPPGRLSWSYYGPWGCHPELPSTRAAICLAFCDECAPDLVWSVRRIYKWERDELFNIADGESDIYMHAIAGYPMLPWSPEVLIAMHDASFLRYKPDNDPFWAVGVAFDTILLGLESFIGPSRAGTQIVSYWKRTRPHLIAHGVLPSAVPYWQRHGFIAVPCPHHPFPADAHPFAVMAWNIPSDAVVARLDVLGIPWWETTERSQITPRVIHLVNHLYSDKNETIDET